jgi:hypothetical protein
MSHRHRCCCTSNPCCNTNFRNCGCGGFDGGFGRGCGGFGGSGIGLLALVLLFGFGGCGLGGCGLGGFGRGFFL